MGNNYRIPRDSGFVISDPTTCGNTGGYSVPAGEDTVNAVMLSANGTSSV